MPTPGPDRPRLSLSPAQALFWVTDCSFYTSLTLPCSVIQVCVHMKWPALPSVLGLFRGKQSNKQEEYKFTNYTLPLRLGFI